LAPLLKALLECTLSITKQRRKSINKYSRFRWASLQLQFLCSFHLDSKIHNSLGRLPPTLETLYSEVYESLTTRTAERTSSIFKNILSWLLCAQRTLKSEEFLTVISIIPNSGYEKVSNELVLDLCANFVVFDKGLDTFRFAHLSVREFLERKPEYICTVVNSLVLEICLLNLISTAPDRIIKRFLSEHHQAQMMDQTISKGLGYYSNIYWVKHCQLASDERNKGTLAKNFRFFLCHGADRDSAFKVWVDQGLNILADDIEWSLRRILKCVKAESVADLFVVGAFDFPEILEQDVNKQNLFIGYKTRENQCMLEICAKQGSCKVMILFLYQRGDDVKITEEVVKAAAGNEVNGKEVMTLLLDRRGDDVKITKEIAQAAARNPFSSRDVMELLLDHSSDGDFEIYIIGLPSAERLGRALFWYMGHNGWVYMRLTKPGHDDYGALLSTS
jgi:hypothetical protein